MAVRIRRDGRVLCAAMFEAEGGDCYLDDRVHYRLSEELRLLVTEPMDPDPENPGLGGHREHGRWWWRGEVPQEAVLERRGGAASDAYGERDACPRGCRG